MFVKDPFWHNAAEELDNGEQRDHATQPYLAYKRSITLSPAFCISVALDARKH